ncbi:M67 family metallopeptidase [Rossellomorea vietnamensis]|uniref:M67 family metallopeptidase n=2 Tax=Rossellomorea vietnamensis TaxID=218284 RepID=A0A5D4KG10_9BACI|nr:M67 family metallopeptidase [Rossellomorea vietnamensis]
MIKHCQREFPFEACGLLSGKNGKVLTLWKMKNMKKSKTEFAIDIEEMKRTFKKMKQKGEEFNGIYHSHPSAAPFPSKTDIKYASYPEAAYFILSLKGKEPAVRCYSIKGRRALPISVRAF